MFKYNRIYEVHLNYDVLDPREHDPVVHLSAPIGENLVVADNVVFIEHLITNKQRNTIEARILRIRNSRTFEQKKVDFYICANGISQIPKLCSGSSE